MKHLKPLSMEKLFDQFRQEYPHLSNLFTPRGKDLFVEIAFILGKDSKEAEKFALINSVCKN